MRPTPAPRTAPRAHVKARRSDLGTLRQREEAWDDHVEEPAVLCPHGCLFAVYGTRLALGPVPVELYE